MSAIDLLTTRHHLTSCGAAGGGQVLPPTVGIVGTVCDLTVMPSETDQGEPPDFVRDLIWRFAWLAGAQRVAVSASVKALVVPVAPTDDVAAVIRDVAAAIDSDPRSENGILTVGADFSQMRSEGVEMAVALSFVQIDDDGTTGWGDVDDPAVLASSARPLVEAIVKGWQMGASPDLDVRERVMRLAVDRMVAVKAACQLAYRTFGYQIVMLKAGTLDPEVEL